MSWYKKCFIIVKPFVCMCAYVNAKNMFILFCIFIYAYVYVMLYYALVMIKLITINQEPVRKVGRWERTVFARSNTGIVGSNPTRDMDVCKHLFCVCVVLCRQRPCDGLIPFPRSHVCTCMYVYI
jgi:hypothetical protein